jgi:hypothetical protein
MPFPGTQTFPYSFKDTAVVITNPALGGSPIVFAGEEGAGEFTVVMHSERTAHDTAADGNIMVSYLAGRSGALNIRVQQVSALHQALLDLYNILEGQSEQGNSTLWAATQISLRSSVTNSQHVLSGVSFSKIPDKPYAAQGQYVTWNLMAANVVNS